MLARLQQFTTFSLLFGAIAWAAWQLSLGRWGWALAGALLILLGYAVVLGLEFLLLAVVRHGDPAPVATSSQLLRAWWGEATSAPAVFCWRQPFRSQAEPDHLPLDAHGRTPCLLVHGFVCNRGFWNPWLRRLRAADVPFIAVNLEPVFGSVDDYVDLLDAAAKRLQAATGRAPFVIAHSMGGLAVRAWLRRSGADVAHVVTIGTPHLGTWLARFGLSANGRQMRQRSDWLGVLAGGEASRYARFTCFYSHCDNIVFPPSTATLPGADNRHVAGSAHVHLAFQEAVVTETLALLASVDASRRAEDRVAQ
jgi:triacylglycerol lipase